MEGAIACVANVGEGRIVGRTQLRVNVTDPDWDDPVLIKSLDRKDPAAARWLAILEGWPCEETIGVEKHGEEYEIVATTVVYNELAEHPLRQEHYAWHPRRYAMVPRQRPRKTKPGSADQPFLIRPGPRSRTSRSAVLSWAHFEAKRRLAKATWHCACRKPRPCHATRRYSLIRPPTPACFRTRYWSRSTGSGSGFSGAAPCRERCGRC